MNLAVVVLNYNDSQTTIEFINNARQIQSIDKIIIVDNASTDDSWNVLKKYSCEKIDVIKSEKNCGYAAGNNIGIKYAIKKYQAKYVAVANPDVILNENAVYETINYLTSNSKTGAVSCKMECKSKIRTRDAWILPDFWDCILENLILLKRILNLKRTSYKSFEGKVSYVEVLPGSFFVMAAEVWENIDYFDEDTFLYGEENILAYKLKKEGYKTVLLNDCNYIHNHSVSISKSIKSIGKKLDMAYDGRCIYLDKYLKINRMQRLINVITYKVGKINYLLVQRLLKNK